MTQLDFARRLRLLRGERGWTVEGLAARAGLSPTTVTSIELGKVATPRIQTVAALARALGIDAGELLYGPEPVEATA